MFSAFEIDQDGLRLELVVQPAISYALVHNRVPVVRRVTLTNRSPLSAYDLALELSVVGPHGPIAPPWRVERTAPVPPGRSVSWEEFGALAPDAAGLVATNEAYPVELRLKVTRPDQPDVVLTAPSRVLAHNEWLHHAALYDLLPAFVQPNTRAVDQILRAASGILLRHTGSGSIEGYQAGPARASLIAGAVYEALRQLEITYQGGMASFEQGQKIRTVDSVLDARLANCLDLSLAYAACLEQAGLHPLLWLTDNHALGGFFLEPERLGSITVTEANLLVSLIDAGRAVPVELTAMGPGVASLDFAEAVKNGSTRLRSAPADLRAAVDVALAHRTGILPLPTVDSLASPDVETLPPEGAAHVAAGSIELPAGAARDRLAERADDFEEAVDERDPAPARVRQWKRSLLDLSLRNPLLNLPSRGKGLDLHVPADALKDLDDLVHQGKRITLVAQDALSKVHELAGVHGAQDLDAAILAQQLREERHLYAAVTNDRYRSVLSSLQRDARTMTQETGSNYLYLTLGTLVHPKEKGGEAHAPLFLLPVRVEGGFGRQPYQIVIDGAETASPNHCLIEWLRVKHRANLPELAHPILDEHGIDIPRTLQALRDGLVAHELNYRIDERASLRLLQFASFQMWRDLTDHWESFMDNPVVRHLVRREGTEFVDPVGGDDAPAVDEARLHLPVAADGSQMRAVVMAEQGRTFVLEGPPGTGKSQTITNMIAQAIHSGRTVLFVAEKQAALEVVKRRLDHVGLGAFALDLHGRKQTLNAIREQLRHSLDAVDLGADGAWDAATVKFREQLGPLTRYPDRVHSANAAGLSLWEAYADAVRYGPGPAATVSLSHLAASADQRAAVTRVLEEFPPVAHAGRPRPRHPWSLAQRRDVAGLDPESVLAAATRLESVRAALLARPGLARVVSGLRGPQGVARLLPVAQSVADGLMVDAQAMQAAQRSTWDNAIGYVQAAVGELWQDYAGELAAFRPEVLASPHLDEWYEQAQEAAGKLLPWSKNKGLQRLADLLDPYLREGHDLDRDDVASTVGRLVAIRAACADIAHQLSRLGGVVVPAGWHPARRGAADDLARAVQATRLGRALLRESPDAWTYLAHEADAQDHAVLAELDVAWRDWAALLQIDEASVRLWAGEPSAWYEAWQRDGETWLRELRDAGLTELHRWSALLVCADPLTHAGLADFRDQLIRGEIEADQAEQAYRRGLAARALGERLQAGDLTFFEPSVHNGRIDQYEAAAEAVRQTLPEYLPSALVRRRGFDPEAQRGPAVELVEQLKRRRGGLSFRELFASYSELILKLTPCVLVSPASAAHFLAPGAATFDIVVFDEASQIRVAEAVGAMGRGRSTVIVGDSRQMPPTSVMRVNAGEAAEEPDALEPVAEDLDSILSEAVESRVPRLWLSWHYRSRDESLIAFSNRRYYESRLFSMPSPIAGTGAASAVVWRRVAGQFDRGRTRTNRVEAEHVVDEIRRRLRDPATAHESIGVVTFNIQQRDLILDLLEGSDDSLVRAAMAETSDEPIFVKNLENVQGDERDTILFSLAFSTDPNTGMLPLNFGPLSQIGGERRLNVAITRARGLVLLFASFDPADIDLARTNAQGTRDLRAYCEMAANGPNVLGDLTVARIRRADEVRDEVAAAIRDRGLDVTVAHGLSEFTVDIAVRRPGAARWQVAIVLDGPDWSRRPTVADRDGAPRLLCRSMSWPQLLRFWLPAWIRDRTAFLDEVEAALARAVQAEEERAQQEAQAAAAREAEVTARQAVPVDDAPDTADGIADAAPATEAAETEPLAAEPPTVVLAAPGPSRAPIRDLATQTRPAPAAFEPFQPQPYGQQGDLTDLISPRARSKVLEVLDRIITAEGPIEVGRLARLTARCFGVNQLREARRKELVGLLRPEQVREHAGIGTYVWPPGLDPDTWDGFRRVRSSTDRSIEEVAPEEVANAATHARSTQPELTGPQLARATAELLGYPRLTQKTERIVQQGIELAVRSGRIPEDADTGHGL